MSNFVMSAQYKESNMNKQNALLDAAVLEQYNQVIACNQTIKHCLSLHTLLSSEQHCFTSSLQHCLEHATRNAYRSAHLQ